jgi:hypothetical protein
MLQRSIDVAAIEAEIERVRSLSGNALRRRWQAVFGRSVPEHLTAGLLRRMIANRVEEEAFGTLDRATLQLLDGLARRSRTAERNLKIGTVLVRDYQGRRHTITVQADGYVWEGKPYSSLSAVARAITGTAWSGPRLSLVPGDKLLFYFAGHGRRSAQSGRLFLVATDTKSDALRGTGIPIDSPNVAHLITSGADPRRMMLLTFSRRAAAEMQRRVERITARALGASDHAPSSRSMRLHLALRDTGGSVAICDTAA